MVFASVAAYGAIAVPADHAERMTKGLEAFDRDVRALLVDNCLNCHGGDKTKGDFSLADRDALLKATNDNGVMTRPVWALMNHLPMYSNFL